MQAAATLGSYSTYPPRYRGIPVGARLFLGSQPTLGQGLKSGAVFEERHFHPPDGAVALLGNNDLGAALQLRIILLIDFFAEDEHDEIGILFDLA